MSLQSDIQHNKGQSKCELSDSDPTNSSHPPTKTKIKLFSFIECTKKFSAKVFRLQYSMQLSWL